VTVADLADLRATDASRFGGKAASLGELLSAGFRVPPGFAIAADAEPTGIELPDGPVAVRSSAIGEDSADASFAGQHATVLNVRGIEAVLDAIRECRRSLAGSAAYRERMGGGEAAMGVVVQEMVDAEVAGVMFTCSPLTGDPSVIAIDAAPGLGEAVVAGEVTPDHFALSKVTGERLKGAGCLDDAQLAQLLDLGKRIERHFGAPQDIEWAFAGELFVLQSRPVTVRRREAPAPGSTMSHMLGTFGVDR
jgi:phosphoenolpyruvate synthase/pyruvate phosphate dikinase